MTIREAMIDSNVKAKFLRTLWKLKLNPDPGPFSIDEVISTLLDNMAKSHLFGVSNSILWDSFSGDDDET